MSKPIRRVYYCESSINGKETWKLTTNILEAQLHQNFEIANSDELDDWSCVSGLFTNTYVLLDDGLFEWIAHTYIDSFGHVENCGEYEVVMDVKNVVLDILDDMRLENSDEYEMIIGMTNWQVWKFVRQFDLNFSNVLGAVRDFVCEGLDIEVAI